MRGHVLSRGPFPPPPAFGSRGAREGEAMRLPRVAGGAGQRTENESADVQPTSHAVFRTPCSLMIVSLIETPHFRHFHVRTVGI
eukprot:492204-Prymnesium_polylepis.1